MNDTLPPDPELDADDEASPFYTRDYRPADAPALATVYRTAILGSAQGPYTPEQCAAWAATSEDVPAWNKRLQDAWVRVACDAEDDQIIGFGGILMPGHIDLLFTLPDYQREGVASLILADLFELAAAMGARQVSTEASELSRPVFEKHGFKLVESACHPRGDQTLTCHRMLLSLKA
jgi:putative acetyltransferase